MVDVVASSIATRALVVDLPKPPISSWTGTMTYQAEWAFLVRLPRCLRLQYLALASDGAAFVNLLKPGSTPQALPPKLLAAPY